MGGATAFLLSLSLPCAVVAQDTSKQGLSPSFGGFLAEIRNLSEPASLSIAPNDDLIVLESLPSRIRVFDPTGKDLRSFGTRGSAPGELLEPQGLALAPDGEIYVSDTGNDRIQVFSPDGTFLRNFGIRGTGPSEFNQPLGLAVDAQRVWVADSRNHRVQIFLRNGRYANELGHFGHDDGELDHPSDIAVDADWNVYVADVDNQRIAVFDRRGTFVRSFGGFGPYSGLFMTPSGIRYHAGDLYVADRDNHRIQVYDTKGELLHEWGVHALRPREGNGKLHYPNQVAIAPSGRFAAVVEAFENRLQLFGPETEESAILQRSQEKSTGSHFGAALDCAGPTLALLEPSAPALLVWDLSHGEPVEISRFGSFGPKPAQLVRPTGIALDRDAARAYVSDPGLARLSIYRVARPSEPELNYIPELVRFVKSLDFRALWEGEKETLPGPVDHGATERAPWPIEPGALESDARGNLWIIDAANARIVELDARLTILRAFGGGRPPGTPDSALVAGDRGDAAPGKADARLLRPTDLALSPSGEILYVVDAADCRVKAFSSSGEPLFTFGRRGEGPTDFVRPFGIATGPDASVYVTDEGGDKIVQFDAVGRPLKAFGREGLGRVEFFKPKGIAVDARGRLVVVDWGNHRGQVLTPEGEFVDAFGSRLFIQPALKKP